MCMMINNDPLAQVRDQTKGAARVDKKSEKITGSIEAFDLLSSHASQL